MSEGERRDSSESDHAQPAGGAANALAGKRELREHSRRWQWFVRLGGPVLGWIVRALWKTLRVQSVSGQEHLDAVTRDGKAFIPCCWHQRLYACVGFLAYAPKVKLGFIISPSRDGELVARMVQGLGLRIIRGSASRTGAQALRDLHQIITAESVCPMLHPDGPRGPAREFKPGTLMLGQWSQAPMLPLAYACDRYWQIRSWDQLIIPKPFARVAIAIGEPRRVMRGMSAQAQEGLRLDIERALTDLIATAEEALR